VNTTAKHLYWNLQNSPFPGMTNLRWECDTVAFDVNGITLRHDGYAWQINGEEVRDQLPITFANWNVHAEINRVLVNMTHKETDQ